MAVEFNLNDICNMKILLGEETEDKTQIMNDLKLKEKTWLLNDQRYNTIKYIKQELTTEKYNTVGKLRSIIYKNNKIVGYSPPKSINCDEFESEYNIGVCYTEDFIEGTMINMFYDHDIDTWVYATKSCVGANVYFFNPTANEENVENSSRKNKTFGEMFLEVCSATNISFDLFAKEYSYSFIFQHPENRIVIPITQMQLFLVRVYSINNDTYTITEINREEIIENIEGNFVDKFLFCPMKYQIYDMQEIKNYVNSDNTPYNYIGIMIYSLDGTRTKLRNPNYEEIRKLRGNHAKLQYQYLVLRQNSKMKEFLLYYPEYKQIFSVYREQLHKYTDTLFQNYIRCYIKKEQKLGDFPHDYKTHMFHLHKLYLDELREQKLYINKGIVQNYVNKIHPALLMYTLNYHKRKHYIDEKLSQSICVE
jgi:hypothetical protein